MAGAPSAARRGLSYRLVRAFARLLLGVFYRRIEVVHAARVPAAGPLILAANHQNALVDPMLLMASLDRPMIPLAKAPLFRHPLIGPFLRLLGALPVHRRQDPGSDPAENEAMFRSATRALAAGGAILVFPEGASEPEPVLRPLRTGTARLLLAAEAAGAPGVALVPAAVVYQEPGAFRAARALVMFGEPIVTSDGIALYATDPVGAVRRLTERLAARLRAVMEDAEDRQSRRFLEMVTAMWAQGSPVAHDPGARAAWVKQATSVYRHLRGMAPERMEALRRRVERYTKALDLAGLGEARGSREARMAAARYAVREGLALILGTPLALLGTVLHVAPYQLTRLAVRALRPELDEEATYKMAAATVLYPLCWVGEGWLVATRGGPWWLAAFVLALLPAGFFALSWRERVERLRRETRGFLAFLLRPDLGQRLAARRRVILDAMTVLGRSLPPDAPAG